MDNEEEDLHTPPKKEVVAEQPSVDNSVEAVIEVPASVLQNILDSQTKLQDEISLLREASNQNKLIQAENSRKPKELPSAFLKVFMEKVVTGWKSERAEIIYNNNGGSPVGEILKATYFFSDDTNSGVVDQVMFTKEDTRLVCRVVDQVGPDLILQPERLETNNENIRNSFVMPSGTIRVHQNFVNP